MLTVQYTKNFEEAIVKNAVGESRIIYISKFLSLGKFEYDFAFGNDEHYYRAMLSQTGLVTLIIKISVSEFTVVDSES